MRAEESRRNSSPRFFTASDFRKLRSVEQVAAVCYRMGRNGIEFLLVQTRNGRWTFPKGGVEAELTHAQTAALEAFEEAGVHGRMEQISFARYTRHKRRGAEVVVHAHLCEVSRLGSPQEANRNPTWFSAQKAKRCLKENRSRSSATEIVRVVDRAVARIRRLGTGESPSADRLQKVQFEAALDRSDYGRWVEAAFAQCTRRDSGEMRQSGAIALAVNAHLSRALRLSPSRSSRLLRIADAKSRVRQLGDGSAAMRAVPQQPRLVEKNLAATACAKIPRSSPKAQ